MHTDSPALSSPTLARKMHTTRSGFSRTSKLELDGDGEGTWMRMRDAGGAGDGGIQRVSRALRWGLRRSRLAHTYAHREWRARSAGAVWGYILVLALALIEAGARDVVRRRARGCRWGCR
jgi:hypothetical protein